MIPRTLASDWSVGLPIWLSKLPSLVLTLNAVRFLSLCNVQTLCVSISCDWQFLGILGKDTVCYLNVAGSMSLKLLLLPDRSYMLLVHTIFLWLTLFCFINQWRFLQLTNGQFEKLAADVYDEVDRRETDASWSYCYKLFSCRVFTHVCCSLVGHSESQQVGFRPSHHAIPTCQPSIVSNTQPGGRDKLTVDCLSLRLIQYTS